MPIILDGAGQPAPFAPARRVREWSSLEGALPSWLESSAVPTFDSPATTIGAAKIPTDAVSGNRKYLRGTQSYALDTFQALKVTTSGLFYAPQEATIALGFANAETASVRGARVVDSFDGVDGTTAFFQSHHNGTNGVQNVGYRITSKGEHAKRRNVSFLLLPPTGEMYLMGVTRSSPTGKTPISSSPRPGRPPSRPT